jgi:hypothetical protein
MSSSREYRLPNFRTECFLAFSSIFDSKSNSSFDSTISEMLGTASISTIFTQTLQKTDFAKTILTQFQGSISKIKQHGHHISLEIIFRHNDP